MKQARKLIEVALPIKEISVESVRDKSIRKGHISTLHLWWARRPLPVCRAVVFASLVPDPMDENCPKAFIDTVNLLLAKDPNTKQDPYKPYDDIPYTAAIDPMEDNPRNRLLMFIGKFSDKFINKNGKVPTKDKIHDACLIKWDSKNDDRIINTARKLIWVAYNAVTGKTAQTLIKDFDEAYQAIKLAERELYSFIDRHILNIKEKEEALKQAIETFLTRMPKVFDPFAGGGAIPLEVARLGCRSFGNDINPVAYIIQKGSLEFPQKFGKPITYSLKEFQRKYGKDALEKIPLTDRIIKNGELVGVKIQNRLSFDVEFYAYRLLDKAKNELSCFFPSDEKGNIPLVFYWARTGICSNPTCKAEVPLLKQFYLSRRRNSEYQNWVYLKPKIHNGKILFEIKKGKHEQKKWNNRGNLNCPVCGNTTDVKTIKKQSREGLLSPKLLAVIQEGPNGREYRLPTNSDLEAIASVPQDLEVPNEKMQRNSAGGDTFSWGFNKWGQLFSKRQLLTLHTLVSKLHEIKEEFLQNQEDYYNTALITYLAILIDRILARDTMFGVWHVLQETVEHPFGRQAIPMIFDFPEMNPFSSLSGSGYGQIKSIINYIEEESSVFNYSICKNATSGEKSQFKQKELTAVVTDPPYYDAIAYADISDFFYVWLKRSLGETFPLNFATPQTPKTGECTALKHHHNGKKDDANRHFENKLLKIFDAIEYQTSEIVSIMFAHQSTEAWTTLCNSILGARMNLTGSWAIDTEVTNALKSNKAFLSSSVTVSCRPAQKQGIGEYREIKKAIEKTVKREVEELYRLGFRGADLLTACFGPAVSEFGRYKLVEKADGTEVTVPELLEMAREAAFNAIVSDIDTDDYTKFYIGWLNLFGFTEAEHDDVRRISQIGLNIDLKELVNAKILIQEGKKQSLASFVERVNGTKKLGETNKSYMIDKLHRAMHLYKAVNRGILVQYIGEHANSVEHPFWRVLTSLSEVLPAGAEDHKSAIGLMTNKESLIRESLETQRSKPSQGSLFGDGEQ